MESNELYRQILGLTAPWSVSHVRLDIKGGEVEVTVEHDQASPPCCPECKKVCSGYDSITRSWRHLDTCQMQTILTACVPRVQCPEHGVHLIAVPWAEPRGRFTAMFEALVIAWLQDAPISAVAEQLRLSWDAVDGIKKRAVDRGLARREDHAPKRLGVDETSFQRRHEYVTVISDQERGIVLHVADDRTEDALGGYLKSLRKEVVKGIQVVAMDMWEPYIQAVCRYVPDALKKIAFDKFHVASHLGNAVDHVRRQEHRELMAQGDDRLKRTKYKWLQGPERAMKDKDQESFAVLRSSRLRTARAWTLKETAMDVWEHTQERDVRAMWKWWLNWARRSKLEPMVKVAKMIKSHLEGIVVAIMKHATNAGAESINAKIQKIKRMACGFRNRERFRNAIYFHIGGLDLLPASLTHTKA